MGIESKDSIESAQEAQEGVSGESAKTVQNAGENGQKKVKKWPVVVMAVVTVLGVSFGIVMMVLWLQEKSKVPEVKVEEKTEIVEKVGDTVTITTESDGENERKIKELLADLAEQIPGWMNIRTNMGVKMPPRVTFVYDMATYPILYHPENLKISVLLNRTYGLMLDSNSYADSVDLRNKYVNEFINVIPGKIEEYLKGKGFVQYDGNSGYEEEYINDDGVICQVGSSWPSAAIQCAYKGWFDAKIAAFSNEVALGTDYPEGEYLGLNPDRLEIKDSKHAPYQTMTGGVLGAAGLWYRVSPDAPWQWFTGAQAVLDCSEYDTDDLKKAFAGEPCYEDGNLKTVEIGE